MGRQLGDGEKVPELAIPEPKVESIEKVDMWEGVIGQKYGKQFKRFVFSLGFLGFYGVLIIPEWLIKVPGPIAILFSCFLKLRKCLLFMDP